MTDQRHRRDTDQLPNKAASYTRADYTSGSYAHRTNGILKLASKSFTRDAKQATEKICAPSRDQFQSRARVNIEIVAAVLH